MGYLWLTRVGPRLAIAIPIATISFTPLLAHRTVSGAGSVAAKNAHAIAHGTHPDWRNAGTFLQTANSPIFQVHPSFGQAQPRRSSSGGSDETPWAVNPEFEWRFAGPNPSVLNGQLVHLYNAYSGKAMLYHERTNGINLGWADGIPSRPTVRVENEEDTDKGPVYIQVMEPVALYFEGGGYLKHDSRDHGIDLRWSETPVYEWEIRGMKTSQLPDRSVRTGERHGLYNRSIRDYVMYCPRPEGINLRWLKDCRRPFSYTG